VDTRVGARSAPVVRRPLSATPQVAPSVLVRSVDVGERFIDVIIVRPPTGEHSWIPHRIHGLQLCQLIRLQARKSTANRRAHTRIVRGDDPRASPTRTVH
jgi:hypothetical protein